MLNLLTILVALALSATITTSDKGATFDVKFDRGAVWTCVVYRQVEPTVDPTESDKANWPDGHYVPRSCGDLGIHSTSFVEKWNPYIKDPKTGLDYNVEWDVWAEIQYPIKGRTDDFTTIETNRVRVRR